MAQLQIWISDFFAHHCCVARKDLNEDAKNKLVLGTLQVHCTAVAPRALWILFSLQTIVPSIHFLNNYFHSCILWRCIFHLPLSSFSNHQFSTFDMKSLFSSLQLHRELYEYFFFIIDTIIISITFYITNIILAYCGGAYSTCH